MKLDLCLRVFKRLEPYDEKLSRTVLRGRRRWQHYLCYPTLILLFSFRSWAAEITAEELVQMSQQKMAPYLHEAKKMQQGMVTSTMCNSCIVDPFAAQNNKKPDQLTKSSEQLLVFVSLSIPKISLQELSRATQTIPATLIMRGLKNNSFKAMATELKELGVTVQIDPNLFKEYKITKVPTFILLTQEPRRLTGNVPLAYAFNKLSEQE